MNETTNILVIIMAIVLIVFLIISIILAFYLVKIAREIKQTSQNIKQISDSTRSVVGGLASVMSPAFIGAFTSGMVKKVKNYFDKKPTDKDELATDVTDKKTNHKKGENNDKKG